MSEPDAAKVETLAVNVTDLAQFAGIDQLFHVADGGVVNEGVSGHDHRGCVSRPHTGQFIHFAGLVARGFSTKTCLPASRACSREIEMSGGRSGDDHRLHLRIVQDAVDRVDRPSAGKLPSTNARRSALESTT